MWKKLSYNLITRKVDFFVIEFYLVLYSVFITVAKKQKAFGRTPLFLSMTVT